MSLSADACARLLQSCKHRRSYRQGQQLHLRLLKSGLSSSLYYGNCLLQMYARCGSGHLEDARQMFDDMPHKNSFTWNSLIDAYAKSGEVGRSVELFNSMPDKNMFSWNAVIAGVARSGDLKLGRRLFEEMPVKDAVALNSIMHGYVRQGRLAEALRLFKSLNSSRDVGSSSMKDDNFVLATALNACARHSCHGCGRQVHARVTVRKVDLDSVLSSALVDMYCKCGDFDTAVRLFDSMPEPDEFSLSAIISGYASCGRWEDARRVFDRGRSSNAVFWNSMLAGYVSNCREYEALKLFMMMGRDGIKADQTTFATVLSACAGLDLIETVKQVHAQTFKLGATEDVVVGTALIDFYCQAGISDDACKVFGMLKEYDTVLLNSMIHVYSNCGRVHEARQVFEAIPNRTVISWNSVIVGYSQNGCATEALELFCEMHRLDLKMDEVTFSTVLSACASICSLGLGEQVFALATLVGFGSDHIVSTSLVDLYCKCGIVEVAKRIFDDTRRSDDATWNSMLMGFATNGRGVEALELFEDMRNANVKLNDVTFIGVLTGCCHCGLVEEGRKWFSAMKDRYNIKPTIEHYSCMVDLLVRAGQLDEAVDFINTMPFNADAGIWTSVLRGCKAQEDDSLGRKVAERLMKLDPEQAGPYMQLSSIYAAHGDWERSAQVRMAMHDRHVKKNPGCSWIDD